MAAQSGRSMFNMEVYNALQSHTKHSYVWNKHLEPALKSQYGSTHLPRSNLTPLSLSQKSQLLPHTQIVTQNFISINPHKTVPESTAAIRPVTCERELLLIPVLRKASLSTVDLTSVLSPFLAVFFKEKYTGIAVTHDEIYMAYLTLYGSIDTMMTGVIANTGTEMADKRFHFVEFIDTKQYAEYLLGKYEYMEEVLGELEEANVMNVGIMMSYACVCMQTIGKQVTEEGVVKWFRHRMRAIMAKLGAGNQEPYENVRPETKTLVTAYKALSFMFEFRRMLIDRMFQYKTIKSRLGTVFSMVLGMVAGTDLTHVFNIDTFLIQTMPELMNLQMLRPYDDQLIAMYAFWKEHEAIFPYVRFYIPAEDCHPINRAVLHPLIIASQAVATYVSNSFKNYKGVQSDSDLYKELSNIVRRYIEIRATMAPATLGLSGRTIIDDLERTMLLERAQIAETSGQDDQLLNDLNRIEVAENV